MRRWVTRQNEGGFVEFVVTDSSLLLETNFKWERHRVFGSVENPHTVCSIDAQDGAKLRRHGYLGLELTFCLNPLPLLKRQSCPIPIHLLNPRLRSGVCCHIPPIVIVVVVGVIRDVKVQVATDVRIATLVDGAPFRLIARLPVESTGLLGPTRFLVERRIRDYRLFGDVQRVQSRKSEVTHLVSNELGQSLSQDALIVSRRFQ